MNLRTTPLFLLLAISVISCSTPVIKISHDFDRGSLGEMVETEPGHFRGTTEHWLKRDSIGDQRYWFYFKADHVKDKTVTFELNDLIGVYRGNPHNVYTGYTQPVYSYDQESWERIEDVKNDTSSQTFQFSQHFENEPVWIAYAHPYPTSRLNSVIDRTKTSEFARIENIAKTKEGRDVTLLNITDFQIPENDKINIMILALQHAGEDAGGYMAEGLIDFLVSDDAGAIVARKNFNYMIVPMMNPDGVYNGTSRYNMTMEDLNNVWLNDDKVQPEVSGVKNWVEAWYAGGNEIDLFLDIHNHTQFHKYNVFIFQDHSLDSMAMVMDKHWPIRSWYSEFKGSSCAWSFRKGIPSTTIELSQSHLDDGKYLTIEDYRGFGKKTVVALNAYFIQ